MPEVRMVDAPVSESEAQAYREGGLATFRKTRGPGRSLGVRDRALGVAASVLLVTLVLPSAVRAATPPPYSHSWYITNPTTSALQALGKSDGQFAAAYCTDSAVVLDFGQVGRDPTVTGYGGYGAYDFNSNLNYPFVTDVTISSVVKSYAAYWYNYSGCAPELHLIIGMSNYLECPYPSDNCDVYAAGQQLASVVYAVNVYLQNNHYNSKVFAWAGDDMETGWDAASKTEQFVNGFAASAQAGYELIDYGDAWQNTGWTDSDVCYVAYALDDWPLPEVYSQDAATRWTQVLSECYMFFRGAMSTTVGNSPNAAWSDLYNTLASSGFGQSLEYSTYIQNQ